MKKCLFSFLCMIPGLMMAQEQGSVTIKTQETRQDSEEVFQFVEEMPEYPGGQAEMMKYIQKNIKYPEKEKENGIQGTVYIGFVVSSTGKVKNVAVTKGVAGGPGIDAEAVRVVRTFPDFKPGRQNGRPVSVRYMLPIKFNLHTAEPAKKK